MVPDMVSDLKSELLHDNSNFSPVRFTVIGKEEMMNSDEDGFLVGRTMKPKSTKIVAKKETPLNESRLNKPVKNSLNDSRILNDSGSRLNKTFDNSLNMTRDQNTSVLSLKSTGSHRLRNALSRLSNQVTMLEAELDKSKQKKTTTRDLTQQLKGLDSLLERNGLNQSNVPTTARTLTSRTRREVSKATRPGTEATTTLTGMVEKTPKIEKLLQDGKDIKSLSEIKREFQSVEAQQNQQSTAETVYFKSRGTHLFPLDSSRRSSQLDSSALSAENHGSMPNTARVLGSFIQNTDVKNTSMNSEPTMQQIEIKKASIVNTDLENIVQNEGRLQDRSPSCQEASVIYEKQEKTNISLDIQDPCSTSVIVQNTGDSSVTRVGDYTRYFHIDLGLKEEKKSTKSSSKSTQIPYEMTQFSNCESHSETLELLDNEHDMSERRNILEDIDSHSKTVIQTFNMADDDHNDDYNGDHNDLLVLQNQKPHSSPVNQTPHSSPSEDPVDPLSTTVLTPLVGSVSTEMMVLSDNDMGQAETMIVADDEEDYISASFDVFNRLHQGDQLAAPSEDKLYPGVGTLIPDYSTKRIVIPDYSKKSNTSRTDNVSQSGCEEPQGPERKPTVTNLNLIDTDAVQSRGTSKATPVLPSDKMVSRPVAKINPSGFTKRTNKDSLQEDISYTPLSHRSNKTSRSRAGDISNRSFRSMSGRSILNRSNKSILTDYKLPGRMLGGIIGSEVRGKKKLKPDATNEYPELRPGTMLLFDNSSLEVSVSDFSLDLTANHDDHMQTFADQTQDMSHFGTLKDMIKDKLDASDKSDCMKRVEFSPKPDSVSEKEDIETIADIRNEKVSLLSLLEKDESIIVASNYDVVARNDVANVQIHYGNDQILTTNEMQSVTTNEVQFESDSQTIYEETLQESKSGMESGSLNENRSVADLDRSIADDFITQSLSGMSTEGVSEGEDSDTMILSVDKNGNIGKLLQRVDSDNHSLTSTKSATSGKTSRDPPSKETLEKSQKVKEKLRKVLNIKPSTNTPTWNSPFDDYDSSTRACTANDSDSLVDDNKSDKLGDKLDKLRHILIEGADEDNNGLDIYSLAKPVLDDIASERVCLLRKNEGSTSATEEEIVDRTLFKKALRFIGLQPIEDSSKSSTSNERAQNNSSLTKYKSLEELYNDLSESESLLGRNATEKVNVLTATLSSMKTTIRDIFTSDAYRMVVIIIFILVMAILCCTGTDGALYDIVDIVRKDLHKIWRRLS